MTGWPGPDFKAPSDYSEEDGSQSPCGEKALGSFTPKQRRAGGFEGRVLLCVHVVGRGAAESWSGGSGGLGSNERAVRREGRGAGPRQGGRGGLAGKQRWSYEDWKPPPPVRASGDTF